MDAHLWAALLSGLTAVWAWGEAFDVDVEHGPDGFSFRLGVCWEVVLVAAAASASCAISLWNA